MDLSRLAYLINKHLSTEDLKDICFEINIDEEQFHIVPKRRFIRELLRHTKRHGKLSSFLEACKARVPKIEWDNFYTASHRYESEDFILTDTSKKINSKVLLIGLFGLAALLTITNFLYDPISSTRQTVQEATIAFEEQVVASVETEEPATRIAQTSSELEIASSKVYFPGGNEARWVTRIVNSSSTLSDRSRLRFIFEVPLKYVYVQRPNDIGNLIDSEVSASVVGNEIIVLIPPIPAGSFAEVTVDAIFEEQLRARVDTELILLNEGETVLDISESILEKGPGSFVGVHGYSGVPATPISKPEL